MRVTPEAREYWIARLGLANWDQQDWEFTSVDQSRLAELLLIYEEELLDEHLKFALMCLIIAALDDRLSEGPLPVHSERVRRLLVRDLALHRETVKYWSFARTVRGDREHAHALNAAHFSSNTPRLGSSGLPRLAVNVGLAAGP
jgi:hypothetical protein